MSIYIYCSATYWQIYIYYNRWSGLLEKMRKPRMSQKNVTNVNIIIMHQKTCYLYLWHIDQYDIDVKTAITISHAELSFVPPLIKQLTVCLIGKLCTSFHKAKPMYFKSLKGNISYNKITILLQQKVQEFLKQTTTWLLINLITFHSTWQISK